MDGAYPFAISFCQVIIDRDDMYSHTTESIEISRKCGNQGFSFSGRHLGDFALVKRSSAYQLDIVGDHIPRDGASASHPMVGPDGLITLYPDEGFGCSQVAVMISGGDCNSLIFDKAFAGLFDNGKSLR